MCSFDWIREHFLVSDSQNDAAESREGRVSLGILAALRLVDATIQFDDQLQFRAVEVSDEPCNHVLSAEAPAAEIAIAEEVPNHTLGRSGVGAQLAGKLDLGLGRSSFAGR